MLMLVMVVMIVVRMTAGKSGATCRHAADANITNNDSAASYRTLMMVVVVLMLKTVDTGDDNEY